MAHQGHHHDHGYGHAISPAADRGHLLIALSLILAFMAVEVVAGVAAHSLALLSDAAHMLTDAGAIGLSLIAMRLAAGAPRGGLTFGLKRAEILSALVNGVTLCVLGVLIVYEAVRRLFDPGRLDPRTMLAVALAGIVVNLIAAWQLAQAERRSLNVEGSYQHILTDLYAFAGTALAAVVVLVSGWLRADAVASLLVAALMLRAAYGLLRAAGRVLLEAAPEGIVPQEIADAIASHPSVSNVHDLHVWEITSGFPALSAHVLVRPGDDCHAVRRDLEKILGEHFRIAHTTMQVDHATTQQVLSIPPFINPG